MLKMTKKQLRQKLEDAYFEALCNGWFSVIDGYVDYTDASDSSDTLIEDLEEAIYGCALDSDETADKAPFKKALKRYEVYKNSPLYKALL